MGVVEGLIGALIAATAAGTGYSIVSGEQGKKSQEEATRNQQQAQQQAAQKAASQQRKSEMAMNMAHRKQPDVSQIMAQASQAASGGPSGTMLTGPTGVNPQDLTLGKNTLLGG